MRFPRCGPAGQRGRANGWVLATVARGASCASLRCRATYGTVGLVWTRPKVDGLGPSARGGHTGASGQRLGLRTASRARRRRTRPARRNRVAHERAPALAAAAVAADHYMIVFGGQFYSGSDAFTYCNDVHVLDLESMKWHEPKCTGDVVRANPAHGRLSRARAHWRPASLPRSRAGDMGTRRRWWGAACSCLAAVSPGGTFPRTCTTWTLRPGCGTACSCPQRRRPAGCATPARWWAPRW